MMQAISKCTSCADSSNICKSRAEPIIGWWSTAIVGTTMLAVRGNSWQWQRSFEAHGTGTGIWISFCDSLYNELTEFQITGIGDPTEAEAIHSAFFGDSSADQGQLQIGSIKTVCGHTEGTAGVAGVLKASLALQNGVVPPNLLFESLNPSLKPFVDHLHLATTSSPWPATGKGEPRRASVNRSVFSTCHSMKRPLTRFLLQLRVRRHQRSRHPGVLRQS